MADDIITRDGDGNLAVNVVTATEADVPYNYDDCFTLDTDGRRALRVVGAGGGSGGMTQVRHDETLKGKGTAQDPLGISDEVMEEIEHGGGGDFVPQLEELPEATSENVGMLAQYSGETIENSDESATIEQTTGSGLTALTVSLDTFKEAEQPSGEDVVDFVCAGEVPDSAELYWKTEGDWTVTLDPTLFVPKLYEVTGLRVTNIENDGDCYIYYSAGEWTIFHPYGSNAINQPAEWGFDISGTLSDGDSVYIRGIAGYAEWEKDGESVDLADYGITYSGTPSENDVLTVTYSPAVVGITNGYFYKNEITEHIDSSISIEQYSGLGVVPSVNQQTFESQISESGTYDFTYNGSAWLLDGEPVTLSDYGITYTEQAEASIQNVSGGYIEDAEITSATFVSAVPATGNYTFTYDGSDWTLNGDAVSLEDYGITVYYLPPEGGAYQYSYGEFDWPESLGSIEVDLNTFAGMVSDVGSYIFEYTGSTWTLDGNAVDLEDYGITYDGVDNDTPYVSYEQTYGDSNLELSVDEQVFVDAFGDDGSHYLDVSMTYDGSDWLLFNDPNDPVDLNDYGITILSGTSVENDEIRIRYIPEYTVPQSGDSILVEYTTPSGPQTNDYIEVECEKGLDSGEVLRVDYTAESTEYGWVQTAVQPEGGSGGIKWAGQWDKPAETQYYYYYPNYDFSMLPEGNYEFYVQNKKNNAYGYGIASWCYKTFKIKFSVGIYNGNRRARGFTAWVLDGGTDFNDGWNLNTQAYFTHTTDGTKDRILPTNEIAFGLVAYNAVNRGVVEGMFRWTNIKNVDTGEEIPVTIDVKDYSSPLNTRVGEYYTGIAVNEPPTPSYYLNGELNYSDDYKGLEVYCNAAGIGIFADEFAVDISLETENGKYHATLQNGTSSYIFRVYKASGDLANVQVGCMNGEVAGAIYIVFNMEEGSEGKIRYAIANIASANPNFGAGTFGEINMENFTAYDITTVGGDVNAENLGMILQYEGPTDANYVNGYFYKATGTPVVVPQSMSFSDYNLTNMEVSISDIDDFVNAIHTIAGWETDYIKEMLANGNRWYLQVDDWENPSASYADFGFWNTSEASVLQYIVITKTGEVPVGDCSFRQSYSPQHTEIQNGAWARVDVQPLGLESISGYDASKTQTLKNVQGVLTWVDDQ